MMQPKIFWPARLWLAARWGLGGQPPAQEGIPSGSAGCGDRARRSSGTARDCSGHPVKRLRTEA